MQPDRPPFTFDMSALLARARRFASNRIGDVTLTLPFVSIAVSPKDTERKVAREIIIRLRDRRVLSARECCDDCIDRSLASLQEIRRVLVDKQVELADAHDGSLCLLLDMMAAGIRQFMTFEEGLRPTADDIARRDQLDRHRAPQLRDQYFAALELLRDHLSHCVRQIAVIAKMGDNSESYLIGYEGPWRLSAYRDATPFKE